MFAEEGFDAAGKVGCLFSINVDDERECSGSLLSMTSES